MKFFSMAVFVLVFLSLISLSSTASQPNILIILADDMGYSDIGCYGGEIDTPNIDRLAREGLRFTQFYNCARCNPSRASLLTGQYPHRAGFGYGGNFGTPAYLGHLSEHSVTLAEVLRQAGYATMMAGKWHLGGGRPHWPIDHGFDRYFGLLDGANSFWEVLPGQKLALDDQEWRPDPDDKTYYFTDRITDYAIEFIDEAHEAGKPFFCYLAHTAPHWPLHAWPEDIAKYEGKYLKGWDKLREERYQRQLELGIIGPEWRLSPRDGSVRPWDELTPAQRKAEDHMMAVYAAMIDRMDQNIGRVLKAIDRLGETDNTLILFLSDNGGCHVEPDPKDHHADPAIPAGPKGGFVGYGSRWANVSNTPFRKFKQFTHEGGIATPLVVRWPDGISEPGRSVRGVGVIADILPTCLAAAGASYPTRFEAREIAPADGVSLLPVFQGENGPASRLLFWEHTGHRAAREGNWKIVAPKDEAPWELYDMKADRTELNNLAASMPETVTELARKYAQWAEEMHVLPWAEITRMKRNR